MQRLLLITFLTLIPGAAFGQSRVIGPAPSRLFALGSGARPSEVPDTLPKVGDHRVTGMVVGGIMGGTLGFLLANVGSGSEGGGPDADSRSDEELVEKTLVTLGGAIFGAGVGYMMGRSTPKGASVANVEPVAPHQDTGLKWWQGGILGLGVGAAAGAGLGKFYDENHDCHCEDPGMGVYTGAVLGGLLGMFMGIGEAGAH